MNVHVVLSIVLILKGLPDSPGTLVCDDEIVKRWINSLKEICETPALEEGKFTDCFAGISRSNLYRLCEAVMEVEISEKEFH